MKILHEGDFVNPKVFEENGRYYIEYSSEITNKTIKEIPKQCCRTCKYSKMYTNADCPYAKFDDNYRIICRNNIEDDFEAFLKSGLTEIEYQKESHWELYENNKQQ